MKWISNPEYKPTLGDTRYVMKFAFLPVYAWSYSDKLRYRVWIQSYKQEQMYKEVDKYYQRFKIGTIQKWINMNNYIK